MIVYGVGPLTARTVSGGLVVNFLDGRRPPGALPETRQPDAAPPRLWGRAMAEDPTGTSSSATTSVQRVVGIMRISRTSGRARATTAWSRRVPARLRI